MAQKMRSSRERNIAVTHPERSEAARQFVLKDCAPQRVRAWLANCPQPPPGVARAQGLQRFGDRGGMMREVVNDRDAADFRLHFEPPLHALEARQRMRDRRRVNS